MLVQDLQDGFFSESCSNVGCNLRFRGTFWSQGKRDDTLPWAVIAAGSGCLFCLSSSPDAQIALWFLPFCFHHLVHPMQSEYFNGPNTARFTVNTGFCPLSTYSAGHFCKIPGYCIVLRWQGIMICWQSRRRETAVGRQDSTSFCKDRKFFTDSKHEIRKPQFLSEGQRSLEMHLNSIINTFILGC